MWGSGRDTICFQGHQKKATWLDWLITPDTQCERRCDDDDEGGSGVCGAFIFRGFTRTLILCSFTDSDIPGNKVRHAGQGCGQALALASRAWVSGQER